jgi:signal transduction histidine kinase
VSPALLAVLKAFPELDIKVLHYPLLHVLVSGAASILGVGLALLVLRVATRAADLRVMLIGMGFLSVASIFFIHAIATPNVVMDGRGFATQISGFLSLVAGGIFFALSGLNFTRRSYQRLVHQAPRWVVLYLVCWTLYAVCVLTWPPLISPPTAQTQVVEAQHAGHNGEAASPPTSIGSSTTFNPRAITSTLTPFLTVAALGCYVFACVRHFQLYRRTPSQAGLALTCGIALLGEALLTQVLANLYALSFWLYHAAEFTGFAVISYAVLFAYRRGQTGEGFLESLFLSGTRERLQSSYTQALQSLTDTISRSEQPTPALRQLLRDRLSLSETQIQVLEQAASSVAMERRQRQELQRLNDELRQIEQSRDQLTQMVVHDLKNPLTAMLGFLEVMRLGALSPDQQHLLESALRSGRNLAGLIEDLLDVGKMEEGRLELHYSTFVVHDLLASCAAQMSAWIIQESKTLSIDVDDDVPVVSADVRLMQRVFLNLISNAIKHTNSGTNIYLRAHRVHDSEGSGGWVDFDVEDTGQGIPPEQLPYIFDKYHHGIQAEGRQRSTGLGLTFCRLAVDAHGGELRVDSTLGKGTTFTVRMPVQHDVDACVSYLESDQVSDTTFNQSKFALLDTPPYVTTQRGL